VRGESVVDCFFDGCGPAFEPGGDIAAREGLARGLKESFEFDLLGGSEGRANIFAKSGGGSGEVKGALGLILNGGGGSEAFEDAGDAALVFEFLEDFEALAIEGVGGAAVVLLTSEIAEVGEGAGDAPAVVEFAEDGQGIFVERMRGGVIALNASDITLIVERPGHASVIAEALEHGAGGVIEGTSADVIALEIDDVGEIGEGTRDGGAIAHFLPLFEIFFEEFARTWEIAAVAVNDGKSVEGDGDALLIPEVFGNFAAFFEKGLGGVVVALFDAEHAGAEECAGASFVEYRIFFEAQ